MIFKNDNFIIEYQEELKDFVDKSIKIFNSKIPEIKNVFQNLEKCQIGAHLFSNRQDFVNYIKKISNGEQPPEWAKGCFYNNEIQIYIDTTKTQEIANRKYTLTHEFIHLCIKHEIYNKFKLNRVLWLDESVAAILDGHLDSKTEKEWQNLAQKLEKTSSFDMNKIEDSNKIISQEYNGYNMFAIIGKYMLDNNLIQTYLQKMKSDIKDVGKVILSYAIQHCNNLNKKQKENYEIY